MFTLTVWGQLVTASQLEYLKSQMFGNTKDYKKIALSIRNNITLGNDGAMTHSKIVEIPGWTQSDLFEMTKKWVLNNVKDDEV